MNNIKLFFLNTAVVVLSSVNKTLAFLSNVFNWIKNCGFVFADAFLFYAVSLIVAVYIDPIAVVFLAAAPLIIWAGLRFYDHEE